MDAIIKANCFSYSRETITLFLVLQYLISKTTNYFHTKRAIDNYKYYSILRRLIRIFECT